MKEDEIEVMDVIESIPVIVHDREYGTADGSGADPTIWDYYTLADGRRCAYRDGRFLEWIEASQALITNCLEEQ